MLVGNFLDRFTPDEFIKQRMLDILYESFQEQQRFSLHEASRALSETNLPHEVILDYLRHFVETRYLRQVSSDRYFVLLRKRVATAETMDGVVRAIKANTRCRALTAPEIARIAQEKYTQQSIRAAIDILEATGVVRVIRNGYTKSVQWVDEQESRLVIMSYYLQRYEELTAKLERARAKKRQIEMMLKSKITASMDHPKSIPF